jgi:hypothetical protein
MGVLNVQRCKDLNNHDKFELIEIYNEILQQREHAQHK